MILFVCFGNCQLPFEITVLQLIQKAPNVVVLQFLT
jgi:hypothetical protein